MATVSEIELATIKDYCGVTGNDSDALLTACMAGAAGFIVGYTGLTTDEVDEYEDISMAYMCLINDMFTRRDYIVDKTSLNPAVSQILAMHSVNYL